MEGTKEGEDMEAHEIRVLLTKDEEKIVRKLAKRDGLRFNAELLILLYLQIREEIDLEEMRKRGEA